jgi:hypothetical protein
MPNLYSLIIHFSFFVGGQPLQLSTGHYLNEYNEPFTVDQCKYYISAIQVIGDHDEIQTIFAASHLVDAADSASLTLHLTTAILKITKIRFTIGVDSEANTGGVHTGDLDPMLGMFWTWNTGYIDARLEGQCDSTPAPAHRFTWDVGGYRPGVNAARQVVLSVPPTTRSASAKPALATRSTSPKPATEPPASAALRNLDLRADLLHWFEGPHPIHLSQSPICHQPGPLAMQLADNYATMFSIAP